MYKLSNTDQKTSLAVALPVFTVGLAVNISLALLVVMFRASMFELIAMIFCVGMFSISSMFYIIGGQFLVNNYELFRIHLC